MNSKHYAIIFSALYVALLVLVFAFGEIEFSPKINTKAKDIIYIEYEKPVEPPKPKPKEKPVSKPKPTKKPAPSHQKPAPKENTQQTSGKAEETRTVNQRAMFQSHNSGKDKPADIGNPLAKQDTVTKASGKGAYLNPNGNVELDEGLLGRGVVGDLPLPSADGVTKAGRVKIRVVVNQSGKVTEAAFEPKGSTSQEKTAIDAALKAARATVFTEAEAFKQGGVITYKFSQSR